MTVCRIAVRILFYNFYNCAYNFYKYPVLRAAAQLALNQIETALMQ